MAIQSVELWTLVLVGGFVLTILLYWRHERHRWQAIAAEQQALSVQLDLRSQALKLAEQNTLRMIRYQLITSRLSESLTVSEIVEVIVNEGVGLLGAVAGSVSMLRANGRLIEIVSSIGYDPALIGLWHIFSVDEPVLIAATVRQRQPMWVGSLAEADPAFVAGLINDHEHQSWATVPLTRAGQISGVLTLSFKAPQHFDIDSKTFILTLAQKCSQALERAELYTEVNEQQEQYRVTLASIGDAVIATDARGKITFMNRVAQQLTGWQDESGIGLELETVFKIVNEETREPVENPFLRVMSDGAILGLATHTLLIDRDGSEIPIDDSGAPIRDGNKAISGVVLVFRDITQRRQQEAELEVTLQRTQDLYEICHEIGLVYDVHEVLRAQFKSRYLSFSDQACFIRFDTYWDDPKPATYQVIARLKESAALPGLTDTQRIIDSPLMRLFSATKPVFVEMVDTDPRLDAELRAVLQANGVQSLILHALTAQDQSFGLMVAYFGQPNHWIAQDYRHIETFMDQVSIALDNNYLLAQEKNARAEAEQANAVRLRFLAMISHELRTPLTSIKGFATTLLATDVTWEADKQREFIEIINDEANKLTELIEQLLDLSRLQAGTLRIHLEPHTVTEIIEIAHRQFELMTVNHQLLVGDYEKLPLVMADKQRIAQVLINLVGNAAKYSPQGKTIAISFVRQPTVIEINVSNDGPTIPIQDRERVFAAFLQLTEPLNNQKNRGARLGLAICKGLIEAHGGHIWIADRVTSGTTVAFTLPIAGK